MIEKDFMWGVSTSAFQIEGNIRNDMTAWEEEGMFKQSGKNPIYNDGSNHWVNWEQDFDLLRQLNVNAYRFSFEWARIQPEPDRFDETALEQYEKMTDKLIALGITPMLTLHHFSNPIWFHKKSPWHKPESVETFVSYAIKIFDRFKERINWFITFNEPIVWVLAAYADGKFPPGEKNFDHMMQALAHIIEAHVHIYDHIKKINPVASIGIAKNFIVFKAKNSWNPFDNGLKDLIHTFYNLMLIRAFSTNCLEFNFPFLLKYRKIIPINNKIDFWGINYYYRLLVNFQLHLKQPFRLSFNQDAKEGHSDLGWENYSKGLLKVFRWLSETGKPIIITENGIAVADDFKRIAYLKSVLKKVMKGLKRNYPLKGYFHWSLLDNYEWLEGQLARFGLVHVDYDHNFQRSIKKSGHYYAAYIKNALKSNKIS